MTSDVIDSMTMRTLLAALVLALALPAGAATRRPRAATAAKGLPFVADDYPRALAVARARNVPLVVDVWAPW